MSIVIGTLNNTLTDIKDTVSQAEFFVWSGGAPRISIESSGNNIIGGTLINNRLNQSRNIEYNVDGSNLITNALTLNQTLYGNVENTNDLTWIIRINMANYQNLSGNSIPPDAILGSGIFGLVMHIRIVPSNRLSALRDNDILFETFAFGEFTTNDSALQSVTFLPTLPSYPLNMYTGTPFTVDTHPTFYVNFSPTVPAYNNHAFMWGAESTTNNINNILSWQQSPNSIGSITCVPTCPSPFVCNTSIGLCEENGVRPPRPIPPDNSEVRESRPLWNWWLWLIIIVVIIIIIVVIVVIVRSKNETEEIIEEIAEDSLLDDEVVSDSRTLIVEDVLYRDVDALVVDEFDVLL